MSPAPNAQALPSRIDALCRADRRRRLRAAITGTMEQRWEYCVLREMARQTGSPAYNARAAAVRTLRNYHRLRRLAHD